MSVEVNSDINYIFIADSNSGNVCLLKLNEDKTFTDIVKESLGDEPKGYMISSTWDTENTSKLKITLDKGDISYLPEKTDEYILDYTNTKVSSNTYRQKYIMNKFNYFVADEAKVEKKEDIKEKKSQTENESQEVNTENIPEEDVKTEVVKNADTRKLQIIGVQNVLYINGTSSDLKNDYKKAEGTVKTIFEIQEGKLVVTDVIVEKSI